MKGMLMPADREAHEKDFSEVLLTETPVFRNKVPKW